MLLPWTRKAHPALGVAVYPGQPLQGSIPCQLVHSPDPSCITAAMQDLLGLLKKRHLDWPKCTSQNAPTSSALLSLRFMALRWLSAQGSRQAEKVGEGPFHPPHMSVNGVTSPDEAV